MVQDQLPAFQNGDALISVYQLEFSETDVYSDEQCVVVCLVQHTGLLLQHWVMLSPGVLCYGQLLSLSPSCGSFLLLYEGPEGSLHLPYIYVVTTARHLVHNSRFFLQQVLVLDTHQLSAKDGCQSQDCLDVVSST